MKKITLPLYLFFLLLSGISKAQVPVLVGMTSDGGKYGNGAIITLDGNGYGFDTLYSFDEAKGYKPWGSLMKASNGLLYGMTQFGGRFDYGIIFSFDPSKNSYTDVFDFNDTIGSYPQGNLTQTEDSNLYGMTSNGGVNSFGTVFKFNPNTGVYSDLHDFNNADGEEPDGSLVQDGNKLYGITSAGGLGTYGVIFSYGISTGIYSKLWDFNGSQGEVPYGSLIITSNGTLYGMTSAGGKNGDGVIFSFDTTGSMFTDVFDFAGNGNGFAPHGSLVLANDDKLYGMTELGDNNSGNNGILFSFNPSGNTFENLYSFNGTTGQLPYGSLLQGTNGVLFGMTSMGGNDSIGNIFSYDPTNSQFANLISLNDTLGSRPYGDLLQISTVSGINQVSAYDDKLSVYPNPSNGTVTITSTKNINELKVTNVLGQLIYLAQPKTIQYNINIKNDGLYFITVTVDNETITKDIIISK